MRRSRPGHVMCRVICSNAATAMFLGGMISRAIDTIVTLDDGEEVALWFDAPYEWLKKMHGLGLNVDYDVTPPECFT